MKKILLFFLPLTLLLLYSCGTTLQNSTSKTIVNDFSADQKQSILNGTQEAPMRVFLITNKNDSSLLRQNCDPIRFASDTVLLNHFIQRLYHTVRDSNSLGVGIAAPQVGILKRIIWVQRFDKTGFPFEVYINPTILKYTDRKQTCPEGCLSIPNKKGITNNRAYAILLKYQSIDGMEHIEMVEDFTSVIFQHEIDHLNGILFTDHLEEEKVKANEINR